MTLLAENEGGRLAALQRYRILDSPPEAPFDRVARVAARLFDVPIAGVTLVDEARIWFKAIHGLDVEVFGRDVGRDAGLCATAILQDGPFTVLDARSDPTASTNPLVIGQPHVRFYAGAPLRSRDGFNVGTVCIADRRPRRLSPDDEDLLVDLAALVVDEMELRILRHGDSPPKNAPEAGITWEEPPRPKSRKLDDWTEVLETVAARPEVWAKIAHYSGETSAYRVANQLRSSSDLPPGRWEFAARRAEEGSDLFARVSASR